MLRSLMFASLIVVSGGGAQYLRSPITPLPPACANTIVHEPLILFESTGGTLVGPYDLELVVYNDGNVRLSSAVKEGGKVATAVVDPGVAQGLLLQLVRGHAFALCDHPAPATDTPLTTLTVMHGDTDSAAHTLSWWVPDETTGVLDNDIRAFVADLFPEF